MLQEFKKFILRGNVVDLAVAVVIGGAFNTVVQSLVKDFITPLTQPFTKESHFADATLKFGKVTLAYGDFLNNLLSFLIIALVVFFLVVQPVNKLMAIAKRKDEPTPEPTTRKCPACLSEIPKAATRCAFCTTELTPIAPASSKKKAA